MQMRATPPATERPTIEPVPNPLDAVLLWSEVWDGLAEVWVGVTTTTEVMIWPSEFVVTSAEVLGWGRLAGADEVGAEVCDADEAEVVCADEVLGLLEAEEATEAVV
jgi:hypothetical protein